MIRVNLLRSMGLEQAAVGGAGAVVSTDQQKVAAFKIIAMVLFVALLYGYETINISALTENLKQVKSRIAEVETKKSAFGDAAPKVDQYNKEKKKIESQVDVIRGLMRNRLREVKALDSLQSITPSQVWFSRVKIDGELVIAEGYSNTPEGTSTLYTALNNSPLFSRFEPKRETEVTVSGVTAKRFEVEFHIGKQGSE